jgi:SRSO17 transposase
VLDMLDELHQWDLRPPVLVCDAGYGDVGGFRQGWTTARSLGGAGQGRHLGLPRAGPPDHGPRHRNGPPPRPRYRDQPCSLTQLALAAGLPAGVDLIWRRGSKGRQRGRFLALWVRPAGISPRQAAARAEGVGWELPTRWLLVEWPSDKAEPVKSWLSNLPDDTPIVELVRLAKLRWRIEQDDRELKGALGLDHFEGRSFGGWHHHVTLVSVAHRFLTLERLGRPTPAASA